PTTPCCCGDRCMHVCGPDRMPEDTYHQVLELLAESPVVQALPPTAALVELKGALRYHGSDARRLGEMLRVRAISQLGVDVRVGVGPSITVAATASAQIGGSGGVIVTHPTRSPTGSPGSQWRPCTASVRASPRCCTTTASTRPACSPRSVR
ncbi:hypothetical protein ACFXB2_37255, partial [Streptomyces griseosporeus]